MDKIKSRKFRRAVDASDLKLQSETRTIEFAFSSELPVPRWFGTEILSHAAGAADLSRLNGGAQLLFNHDSDRYIGVIENAWIGDDKRGYVKVRFSKNADSDEIMQDVADGILKNVSFGYMIDEILLTKHVDGAEDEYTATKWTPYEVSFVTVPADPTVGVGRAIDDDELGLLKQIEKTAGKPALKEEIQMPELQPIDEKSVREQAVRVERERTAAISALCEKYNQKDLGRELIDGGKSIDEARAAVLDRVGLQKPITGNEAMVGLTEKEVRQFSFVKAINALANPNDRNAQEAAKFEREVSLAATEKCGKASRGFMVPVDVLRSPLFAKRDLTVGTSTAGGDLVETALLASSFIDLLRNKSVLQRAGAMVMNGLMGNVAIPRMTGGATAYWVAESGAPTESAQAFDQVTMSPKTVGAFTDYSRKLMLQSSLDVEALIRNDLATVMAIEIDRAGLYGSGSSNQPTGVKNVSGINTSDFAANTPTWAELVGLETSVAAANADVGTLAYVMNATGRGVLKTTVKASNTGLFMWENGTVNGYRAEVSNQVASNDFWFGNWADLIMGFWSGLDVLVDPYTGSTTGTVRVVALQDVDVAVRHAVSFTRGNNTL